MPQFLRDIVVIDARYFVPALHIIFYLAGGYILLKLIDSGLKRLPMILPHNDASAGDRLEQRTLTLRYIIRSVSKGALIVIIVLQVIFELFGKDITPLLTGAGIAGLAIGFGAQSLVKDVISGFFILFEDQFGVGDVVKIGEFTGVVERMTLRATVLRNLEGQVYVVPNGNIQHVTVMTKEWARAVLDITVTHDAGLPKVFEVLQRVGHRLAQDWPDRVLEQPTTLGIEKIEDRGITIRCVVKTPPFKNADVLREWRRRVIEEFDRSGVQLPVVGTAAAPAPQK